MKPLRLILTASGCPGSAPLIKALRAIREREFHIIATDVNENAIGRYLADRFYTVPSGQDEKYIDELLWIAEREKPDILFPQSSYEIYPIALNRHRFEQLGVKVLVSDPESIRISNDKYLMYEALTGIVPCPKYYLPNNLDEFVECAKKLGYPKKPVCFKPPVSKGGRGFCIVKESIIEAELLLYHLRSSGHIKHITMDDFKRMFESVQRFPQLLLMEYIDGEEYTVDAIVQKGEILFHEVKTREDVRKMLAMTFEKCERPKYVEYARKILRQIPLDYCVNIQIRGGMLLEINPRVSTFIYQEDLVPPYLAIKFAMGEITENELRGYQSRVRVGLRSIRYYDQIFF